MDQPPESLDDAQRARVRQAIAAMPEKLPQAVRERLAASLRKAASDDASALLDYMVRLCDAAIRNDARLPSPPRFRSKDSPATWNRAERRDFERMLPAMLDAQQRGAKVPLPPGAGDREMGGDHRAP